MSDKEARSTIGPIVVSSTPVPAFGPREVLCRSNN